MFLSILGYCLFAFTLAAVEIEIEGKHGWGEKLPTWYRTKGRTVRIYQSLLGKRPLTGYAVFMTALVVLSVHMGFFNGVPWSPGRELEICARYAVLAAVWDFLWFVLNPHYTLERFRPEHIWWHRRVKWITLDGVAMPAQYMEALVVSCILALAGGYLNGSALSGIENHVAFTGGLLVFVFLCQKLAPRYHAWYHRMRAQDDRDDAGISHT